MRREGEGKKEVKVVKVSWKKGGGEGFFALIRPLLLLFHKCVFGEGWVCMDGAPFPQLEVCSPSSSSASFNRAPNTHGVFRVCPYINLRSFFTYGEISTDLHGYGYTLASLEFRLCRDSNPPLLCTFEGFSQERFVQRGVSRLDFFL